MANKLQKLMINRTDLVDNPSNPLARVLLFKSELNAAARKKLSNADFAYISPDGTQHLPIHDAAHVRNALARLDQTDIPANAKASAKRKIDAAAKRFGIKISKGAQTTNDVLAVDEFWSNYNNLLDAFRQSVGSIMYDSTIAGKDQLDLLKTSIGELADNLNSTFESYPMAKNENDEIYTKFEKTVDVLQELGTLIDSGEISVEEVSDILEGLEMAETVETLKAQIAERDMELVKAKKDVAEKQKELDAAKQKMAKNADEPIDIWKGVAPEIKAKFEALEKSADESAKIAKAAEENAAVVRLNKRVADELAGITGSIDEKTTMLRDVEKMLPADKFEKLYAMLKTAAAVIQKSELLNERGMTGAGANGTGATAFEKLQAKAKELVDKKQVTSEAKGITLAAKQNPELYKEYLEGLN